MGEAGPGGALTCPECGSAYIRGVKYCAHCGTMLTGLADLDASEPLPAGTLIGGYRLLDLLGEGGMGRVYLAEHVKLGRRVAVKMLRAELVSSPVAVARFFAEARAVNRISHENIVEITDFIEQPGGDNCIIMELLKGEDLGQRLLRKLTIALPRALDIGAQTASALAAVHDAGMIHRDLKPDNVFLIERSGSTDFVKLLDFGVAKLTDPSGKGGISMHSTAAGQIIGTPEYMSPEQAGGQAVDFRTDIYALGVILYEMLAGSLPFVAKSFGELLIKHMTEPVNLPPATPGLPPGVQAARDRLILDLLAKDPNERPKSMREVEQRMRELIDAIDLPVPPKHKRASTSGSHTPLRDARDAKRPSTPPPDKPLGVPAQKRLTPPPDKPLGVPAQKRLTPPPDKPLGVPAQKRLTPPPDSKATTSPRKQLTPSPDVEATASTKKVTPSPDAQTMSRRNVLTPSQLEKSTIPPPSDTVGRVKLQRVALQVSTVTERNPIIPPDSDTLRPTLHSRAGTRSSAELAKSKEPRTNERLAISSTEAERLAKLVGADKPIPERFARASTGSDGLNKKLTASDRAERAVTGQHKPNPAPSVRSDSPELGYDSGSNPSIGAPVPTLKPKPASATVRKSPTKLVIAVSVAALAVVAAVARVALHGETVTPPPSAQSSARDPSTAPLNEVKIKFVSAPPGATVRIAGTSDPIGITPFTNSFPRTNLSMKFQFEKPGYQAVTENVSLATDDAIAVALVATPVASRPATGSQTPMASQTVASQPASKPGEKKPIVPGHNQPATHDRPVEHPKDPALDRNGTMDVFGTKPKQ